MVPAFGKGATAMTKLSDTQLVILNAACKRPSRLVLPLPDTSRVAPRRR